MSQMPYDMVEPPENNRNKPHARIVEAINPDLNLQKQCGRTNTVESKTHIIGCHSKPKSSSDYKKRVAAYTRVSTDYDEQENSFLSQVAYFAEHISKNPNWQLAGIYADQGTSGLLHEHRPEFNRLIADAEAGKIDLILTKSISRFARNTVDSITFVRKLRAIGVEVLFEKENFSSFDTKSELLFSIYAAAAQQESKSISENVNWSNRRRIEAGKPRFSYKNFLGYRKGKDGEPEIVEEEAKIVRRIFQSYLDGASCSKIAKELMAEGVLSPSGRLTWTPSSVKRILANEKYKGCCILGKTYTEDYLTKKVKVNRGEKIWSYAKNTHAAIIDPKTYDEVQKILKREFKSQGLADSPVLQKWQTD